MPKETQETSTEPKQLYYTNPEVRTKLLRILKLNEIQYLSIKVTTKNIEVIQAGQHDSAGALAKLFTAPGIFGFDEEGDSELVNVREDVDMFNVVLRTVTDFSRAYAEPMFADDGTNDDDEGSHTSPEEPNDVDKSEGDNDFSPEVIGKLKKKDADELLEAHGLDPKDFASLKDKRTILTKVIFIESDA